MAQQTLVQMNEIVMVLRMLKNFLFRPIHFVSAWQLMKTILTSLRLSTRSVTVVITMNTRDKEIKLLSSASPTNKSLSLRDFRIVKKSFTTHLRMCTYIKSTMNQLILSTYTYVLLSKVFNDLSLNSNITYTLQIYEARKLCKTQRLKFRLGIVSTTARSCHNLCNTFRFQIDKSALEQRSPNYGLWVGYSSRTNFNWPAGPPIAGMAS
ncbi:hypothetical protein AGLY_005561 [Aphis glycines]|uniref:Uncharacterized protein n=1 Tax=Aphis glycines TaxID=307491 RepID=A0A6G0TT58_APHGL|nr:hypothetical protein AGLY_005561 [Aphis glycines]